MTGAIRLVAAGEAVLSHGEHRRADAVHLDWLSGKAGQLRAFVIAVRPEVRLDHHSRSVSAHQTRVGPRAVPLPTSLARALQCRLRNPT
jgi:hypothetical protein